MGSMYFFGMTVSGIFITRLADIYGRLPPVRWASLASIPLSLIILLSKSLPLSIVMFFFQGACSPGKCQVTFVFSQELVPKKYQNYIGSAILFGDASTMLILAVYHGLLSKNWVPLQLTSFILNIISVLGIWLLVPESPKWLIGKGRYSRARESLKYLAKMNGVRNY
jgi:MFS family permease